jgi:hypothetical protein
MAGINRVCLITKFEDEQKITFDENAQGITGVWALAFVLLVATEAAILYVPSMPQKAGIWVAILVIYEAFRFTVEYPKRQQADGSK